MTDEEAMRAVGRLVGGIDAPWGDATVREYVAQLAPLQHAAILEQACAEIVKGWAEHGRRPLVAEVAAVYYEISKHVAPPVLDPVRVHCDGTGWRPAIDGMMTPCPRCNPAVAAIFADPDKLARWLDGAPPEQLNVGVERVGHRLRFKDGVQPPRCSLAEAPVVDWQHGLRAAWKGYAADCAEHGREPSRKWFEKTVGLLADEEVVS